MPRLMRTLLVVVLCLLVGYIAGFLSGLQRFSVPNVERSLRVATVFKLFNDRAAEPAHKIGELQAFPVDILAWQYRPLGAGFSAALTVRTDTGHTLHWSAEGRLLRVVGIEGLFLLNEDTDQKFRAAWVSSQD